MAHTNVQLVSGNLTTGQASPTFFIDRVNDKIGIGGVPDITGVEADPATSNVLQVTGNMLATRYHGDGSTLTGIEGSKWALTDDGINRVGNVGIGGDASATTTTKLYVHGDIDIESGSSLRIGGVIPVYSNWVVSGDNISRSLGNVGIGGDASATAATKLYVHGDIDIQSGSSLRIGGVIPVYSNWASDANGINRTTGNVGIGGVASTTATTKLYVHGDILATGDVTASSDRRLKTDIKHIENALDKVCSLGGYTYVMNDKPSSGLIAQEVLEVLPEVVHGSEETNYSLAYGNIVGLLVEAIKELKEKIG